MTSHFNSITLQKISVILIVCHLLIGFVRAIEESSQGAIKSSKFLSEKELIESIQHVSNKFASSTASSPISLGQFIPTGQRTARRYTPHIEENEEFCYNRKECGPGSEHWDGLCEDGDRQSPIDIDQRHVVESSWGGPVFLNSDYRERQPFWLMNSGHTVSAMLNPDLSSRAAIQIEGAKKLMHGKTHIFAQVHFHWGSKTDIGSEHTLNGQRFAMEAHFVHYNAKYYNLSAAMEQPDGLAIFAVLFEETPHDNLALKPIVHMLSQVRQTRKMVQGSNLDLTALLPIMSKSPKNAFHYKGSLTTPDCHESATWIVFEQCLGVSRGQLEAFRSLIDSNGGRMVNNFRATQPRNKRKIRKISVFCGENCQETGLNVYSNRIGKGTFPFIIVGPKIRNSISKAEVILSLFHISIYIVTICWILSLLNKTNTI